MDRTVEMSGTVINVDRTIARNEDADDIKARIASLRAAGLVLAANTMQAELDRRAWRK